MKMLNQKIREIAVWFILKPGTCFKSKSNINDFFK